MTRLLVIDTETGGLDPDHHSLLSLGAVVWADGCIEGEIEIFISEPEMMVTAQALEINRIDLAEHVRGAAAPNDALRRFLNFIADHFGTELALGEQVVLVGHNLAFDVSFLRRLCRLAEAPYPALFSHRTLDTASVLKFLSLAGLIPVSAVASNEAFSHFGIVVSDQLRHTALGDARATAELLTSLLRCVGAQEGRGVKAVAA